MTIKKCGALDPMKLKNKLMLGALCIAVFTMILSMVITSVMVDKQNRETTNGDLMRTMEIIREEINLIRGRLNEHALRMAQGDDMGAKIQFLNEEDAGDFTRESYREVVRLFYNVCVTADLRNTAVYSKNGSLIGFVVIDDEEAILGYPAKGSENSFNIAHADLSGKLNVDKWEESASFDTSALIPEGGIPGEDVIRFEIINQNVCLAAYKPITAMEFNPSTEQLEPRPVGILRVVKYLDKHFLDRIAKLSGASLNIFSGSNFSAGHLPAYETIDLTKYPSTAENWKIENQEAYLKDCTINGESFYQGILPLYSSAECIGAISALYSKKATNALTWRIVHILMGAAAVCIVIVFILINLFSKSLTKPIYRIVNSLNESVNEISTASGEISANSKILAQGASTQAASLSEASHFLEQISDMSRETLKITKGVEQLMNENIEKSGQSMKSMIELNRNMSQIEEDSEKISNIIKTIDGIAFQTNLLALNAAVEAARAGDAGTGFAVVAGEVRNLATRSTEAAKSTQQLLDSTVHRVVHAAQSIKGINTDFEDIIESATIMGERTISITNANEKQSEEIRRISEAVKQIDNVTQQTAAGAEESASSSHVLFVQTGVMRTLMDELIKLVSGGSKQS